MKIFTLSFAATLAAALGALAVGQAAAQPARHAAPATLTVVMHDPGCHWFSVGGRLTRSAAATAPVRLVNLDEATLVARTPAGKVTRVGVGAKALLGRGRYVITMVGQAPDDNHLKLTVS